MRKKFGTYIIVIIVAVLLYRFARHYTSFDVSNFSDVVSLFEIILTLTLTFLVDRQQLDQRFAAEEKAAEQPGDYA